MWNWIKSHKLATTLVIVLAVGAWLIWGKQDNTTYAQYTVERSSIEDTLELSGKVVAGNVATLRFGAGGLISYMGAMEGDAVKKWQTLASIDTRQLQKTLEQKLNLYAIQRGTFEQTIDDSNNSVPDGDLGNTLKRLLEKNQYQLDNTVKDVEYLDLSVKLSRISSPIAGVLTSSPITTTGVQVTPTDAWVVVDPSSLYFSADLDETELKRVTAGQKVIIALDAYPDKTIHSSIETIAYTPKETTSGTTYEIKLKIATADMADLRLGLNGTASIILHEKEGATTLDSRAITTQDGATTVLVKDGNKYVVKPVSTGIESNGRVEITDGLMQGDIVYVQN